MQKFVRRRFSLIVTSANFVVVKILTNGGPVDKTHVFATWACRH
jgi:multiple sugar transport system permease protein